MEVIIIRPRIKGFFLKQYLAVIPLSAILISGGAAVLLLMPGIEPYWAALPIALGLAAVAIALAHSALHCKVTSVSFDGDKIVHETGILDHKKKKVPINMVTDSSASRTFIEKFFGTGTLSISTSGSSGYEIVCHGLDYHELDRFHTLLYEKIKYLRPERHAGT